jgi:SAM-dependent methyltransferase
MNRIQFFNCLHSPKGKLLQQAEAAYLRRAITVSCKQTILQIGGLGWENQFIDCSLYQRFVIIDNAGFGSHEANKITAIDCELPIMTDSIDMVIVPHMLEFAKDQHQMLREIERVLKPEGKLIILAFNPWNYWVRYQFFHTMEKHDRIGKHLVNRLKMLDWLKLLNFEVEVAAGFNFTASQVESKSYKKNRNALTIVAFAVKAIKRRYTIIPSTPIKFRHPRFSIATSSLETSVRTSKHV